MKKYIVEFPDNWKDLGLLTQIRNMAFITLLKKEAVEVELPPDRVFSAVFEVGGKKEDDWSMVTLYAVRKQEEHKWKLK